MVTIRPALDTITRSTWTQNTSTKRPTKSPASTKTVRLVRDGWPSRRISAVSDWKTRTVWSGTSRSGPAGWLERNNFMRRPGSEMLVLLVPEIAVDVATLDQLGVRPDVVDLAALQNHDRVGIDQRRQP